MRKGRFFYSVMHIPTWGMVWACMWGLLIKGVRVWFKGGASLFLSVRQHKPLAFSSIALLASVVALRGVGCWGEQTPCLGHAKKRGFLPMPYRRVSPLRFHFCRAALKLLMSIFMAGLLYLFKQNMGLLVCRV